VTLGWSNRHTSAHLYRSLLEGIAFELRYSLEEMAGRGKILSAPRITVGGGGAQSALWLSIIRDVLGLELRRSEESEPVALGAAMLAAVAAGMPGGMAEAARRFVRAGPWQAVDRAAQASYDELYREVYVPLRRETLELSARLSKLASARVRG
jgi:xylulokinase